jgi:hypothetical protein
MLFDIAFYGTLAGLIHFVVMGVVYGNPIVNAIYARAQETEPGVRRWRSRPRYLVTQFLGTQVEVYLIAIAFIGAGRSVAAAAMITALRLYPRLWNMWIQSTYPNRLLAIEVVNGTLGTIAVTATLRILT